MHQLYIPAGLGWELLVVNNNCTDDTDEVIARHRNALPIRRLFEPKQGHCNARNCAITSARGELLIWTDDDVLVDPGWLAAYAEVASRWPDAGYFGGTIEPWFECPPPAWIVANRACLEAMLVIRELSEDEHYFREGERPWGANMAFRTEILRDYRFDPNLGLTGSNHIRSDETNLIESLRSRGIQGVWVPQARVRHYVTKQRLTRCFVWEYYYGYGRTSVRLGHVSQAGKKWGGVPRWLIRQAATAWAFAHVTRLWSQTNWVEAYTRAAATWGIIAETRRLHRNLGQPDSDDYEFGQAAETG